MKIFWGILVWLGIMAQENNQFPVYALPTEIQERIKMLLPAYHYAIVRTLYAQEKISSQLAEHVITDGLTRLFFNLMNNYKVIKEKNGCVKQTGAFRNYKEKKLYALSHAYEHCSSINRQMLSQALDCCLEGKALRFEPYMTPVIRNNWTKIIKERYLCLPSARLLMINEYTFRPINFYCYNFESVKTLSQKLSLMLMLLWQVPGNINIFDADDKLLIHLVLPSSHVEWDFKLYEAIWKLKQFFKGTSAF